MKIGVSEPGLQNFVDQTQKAAYLRGFSQTRILIKSVEFRVDFGQYSSAFS